MSGVPSGEDIVESIAGMWSEIGVKTNLVSMDNAAYRYRQRAREITNEFQIGSTSSDPITATFLASSFGQAGGRFELPAYNEIYSQFNLQMTAEAQEPLLKQMGNLNFDNFMYLPLFWVPTELIYNPEFVAEYIFPGNISGSYTYIPWIKAVSK